MVVVVTRVAFVFFPLTTEIRGRIAVGRLSISDQLVYQHPAALMLRRRRRRSIAKVKEDFLFPSTFLPSSLFFPSSILISMPAVLVPSTSLLSKGQYRE